MEKGSITNLEAFQNMGATRLGAVIFELRKKGYTIQTLLIDGYTPDGIPVRYGKYILTEESRDLLRRQQSPHKIYKGGYTLDRCQPINPTE